MIYCKTCGKEVKFIAISLNQSVTCDVKERTFYTITGRKVVGYEVHECKKETVEDGKK